MVIGSSSSSSSKKSVILPWLSVWKASSRSKGVIMYRIFKYGDSTALSGIGGLKAVALFG